MPPPRHWPTLQKLAEAAPVVHETSLNYYRENILPALVELSVAEIVEATGPPAAFLAKWVSACTVFL